MRLDETRGLLKSINSQLSSKDIDDAIAQYGKRKNVNEKVDFDFGDVGALCKILSEKSDKQNYIAKSFQDQCTLKRVDDRFGVEFDELYNWLAKLARDDKYFIDKESCRKLLNGPHYKGLKIRDNFYLPQIRQCGQLILREMK